MVLPSVPSAMALVVLSGNASASSSRTVSGSTCFSKSTTKLRPPVKSILLLKPLVNMKPRLNTASTPKTVKLLRYAPMILKVGFWKEILLPMAVWKVRFFHLSRLIISL